MESEPIVLARARKRWEEEARLVIEAPDRASLAGLYPLLALIDLLEKRQTASISGKIPRPKKE